MMPRLAILGSLSLSVGMMACGSDNNGGTPDSPIVTPDAPTTTVDAKLPDAPAPDAAAHISGTVAVHDVQLLQADGTPDPAAGHGGQITISFTPASQPVKSVNHDQGPIPCNGSYSVAASLRAAVDEGTVTFTTMRGTGAGTPIPDCTFQASTGGYLCIGDQGNGGTIAAAANNAASGFLTFTDSNNAKVFASAQVGRYLILAGGGANAGDAFPITGASGNQLGLVNLPALGSLPFTLSGPFIIAAGVGPVPASSNVDGSGLAAPPDFLVDGDMIKVKLTPGGGHNIAMYEDALMPTGGHLALDAATKTALSANGSGVGTIDLTGTKDFTISLDAGNTGAGLGIVVTIDATDATNFGAHSLGTPTMFSGSITCAAIAATSVTIPKDIMGVIGMMNPTILRVSVFRDFADLSAPFNFVAGHGLVTFLKTH